MRMANTYANKFLLVVFLLGGCGVTLNEGDSEDAVDSNFVAENICAGIKIFGRLGSAICPEKNSAGNAFRDTVDSITLKQEQESGVCHDQADVLLSQFKTRSSCEKSDVTNQWVPEKLTDERLVSDATKDFERISGADYNSHAARKAHRDMFLRKYSDSSIVATFPVADCGVSGSHEARAIDCDTMWMASLASPAGGSNWTLISLLNGKEVWRDESTGLLWGDYMGDANHCRAAGNNVNSGYDCSANTESWCAETDFVSGVTAYDVNGDAKGGMGLTSTTGKVLWRLPTREDYLKAAANGAYHVLPELIANSDNGYMRSFWTASVSAVGPNFAWYFVFYNDGGTYINADSRGSDFGVRCVGR